MRLLVGTIVAVGLLVGVSPQLRARAPKRDVQRDVLLIEGTARIVRGRVRRARGAATHRALLAAVWRQVEPRLATIQGRGRLKRLLSRRVRRLIKRYRTRKVTRDGRLLKVLLAVTVDEPALRARLGALKVRLKRPGVLVLAHCEAGPMAKALTGALGSMSIRTVTGPWSDQQRAAMVITASARPAALLPWARKVHAQGVVLARCETRALSKIAAAGVTGVRAKVVAVAYALGGSGRGRASVRQLLRIEQVGIAHHADSKLAESAALTRGLGIVARRLGLELPPRLPMGLTRTLLVRLRGPLGLGSLLNISRQIRLQLPGVQAVKPRRFRRGVTWLAVQTIYDPSRLQQILTTVRPPSGWLLHVGKGPRPGTVDVRAELTEES
jgi:hypothetical protein